MISFTKVTAALAAQRSHQPGYAARAQAVPAEQAVPGEGGVSSARAKALQECTGA